jgi:HSF-type DNA-binding
MVPPRAHRQVIVESRDQSHKCQLTLLWTFCGTHGRFFNQSKYTSFQRQLNLYGFHRVSSGPDKNSYYHPLLLRGRPDLCRLLLRTRVKGSGGGGGGPISSCCSGEDLLWQALGGSSLVESVPRVATPTTFDALPSLRPLLDGYDEYNVVTNQSIVPSSTTSAHQTDLTCVSEEDAGYNRAATSRVPVEWWPLSRTFLLPDAVVVATTSSVTATATTTTNHADLPVFPDLHGSSTYHPGLLTSSHMAEILMGEVSTFQEMDVAIIHDPLQQQHKHEMPLLHSTNLPSAAPTLHGESIPWLVQSGNPAFIPSTEDAVSSDDDYHHHPEDNDAHNDGICQSRGGGGGYESGAVGFFEGQTFRCMDDENLRLYESKIIGA